VKSLGGASYGSGEDYYGRYSGLVKKGYVSPRNLRYYHVDNYYYDMSFNNLTGILPYQQLIKNKELEKNE
jgi:hypothetical protein